MDHLLNYGASEPISVPYLCNSMYNGGDFETYPQRAGWDLDNILIQSLQGRTVEGAAAFLQTYLYFGVLHQFFAPVNEYFDPFDFVADSTGGGKVVTTRKLPEHIARWQVWDRCQGPIKRSKRLESIKSCLEKLRYHHIRFCRIENSSELLLRSRRHVGLDHSVCLSITVLADSLTKAGFEITGHQFNLDWGADAFLQQRMRRAGWCPRAIATCIKGQQIHALYYASTLGSTPVPKNHEGCDDKLCKWEQIDESTYSTQHRSECGGCDFIGPCKDDYTSTFRVGRTPLVSFAESAGRAEMLLSHTTECDAYVAISHVWSDGLGNQYENKLPTCQARYLQSLVDQLQSESGKTADSSRNFWWCDTICVPVGDEHREWRKAAIRNMAQIYGNAAKVLALDSTLVMTSKEGYIVELFMRLKLSSWARRLWTLQEGRFARDVYVQFSNGTRTIRDIAHAMEQEAYRNNQYLYTRNSWLAKTWLRPFCQAHALNRSLELMSIGKQLQWRATSHAADEAVCLATVLGLDPGPVLDIPAEDLEGRMVKLFQLVRTIPFVLLTQPPPRLSRKGFRWAPRSLLNCFRETSTDLFLIVPGTGNIDTSDVGITLCRSGLEILGHDDGKLLLIGEEFSIALPSGNGTVPIRVTYWFNGDKAARNTSGGSTLECPVIIFLTSPLRGPVVLADIFERADGTMEAVFIATVVMLHNPASPLPDLAVKHFFQHNIRQYQDQFWHLH